MKISLKLILSLLLCGLIIPVIVISCKKEDNPIKFIYGTFPDSIINLEGINSANDDYNTEIYQILGGISVVFSSNRQSSGGQFDFVQGKIDYTFNQTSGAFDVQSEITNDSFISKLLAKANTSKNDFGPYRFFSTVDGFEYMIYSSENESGNLDFFYLKNSPVLGVSIPEIKGPYPLSLLNTSANDAYISFDSNLDSIYFSSDRTGNFDIFLDTIDLNNTISYQFDLAFRESVPVTSLNSEGNDKCPYFHKGILIFASDRLGGLGGYDLYYSVLKNKKWSSPVNFGPGINTASNEYRPVLGSVQDFNNYFLIFSSDRPGGKDGYDLYLTGFNPIK